MAGKNVILLIAVITAIFLSGCIENAEKVSDAVIIYKNQDVAEELNIYANQFSESADNYKDALDTYNIAINNYNSFIYEYNEMSYFQQTSSSTVNEKSNLESQYKSAARSLIIQCEVMEAQINDMNDFIEENDEFLKTSNAEEYLEIKSILVELEASVKTNKLTATEMLYK